MVRKEQCIDELSLATREFTGHRNCHVFVAQRTLCLLDRISGLEGVQPLLFEPRLQLFEQAQLSVPPGVEVAKLIAKFRIRHDARSHPGSFDLGAGLLPFLSSPGGKACAARVIFVEYRSRRPALRKRPPAIEGVPCWPRPLSCLSFLKQATGGEIKAC
ncbi:MAG TPA: hypothetical protein PLX99_09220 [Gammaproteobacteria bacterium]|nr:hypothetical protein [Gammaproteobacteria bacterium]